MLKKSSVMHMHAQSLCSSVNSMNLATKVLPLPFMEGKVSWLEPLLYYHPLHHSFWSTSMQLLLLVNKL